MQENRWTHWSNLTTSSIIANEVKGGMVRSDVLREGSEAHPKALKNGLWRARRDREVADGDRSQHSTCGEMEHTRGLSEKDDDGLSMFFFSALAPAGDAFSAQHSGRERRKNRCRCSGSRRVLLVPHTKSGRWAQNQHGQVAMHHSCHFGSCGKAQQMPGMFPLFEHPILNHATPVREVKSDEGISWFQTRCLPF